MIESRRAARGALVALAVGFTACEPVAERLAPDASLVNEASLTMRILESQIATSARAELLPGSTIDVVYDPGARVVTIEDAALLVSDLAFEIGVLRICASDIRLELVAGSGGAPSSEVAPVTGRLRDPLYAPVRASMELGVGVGTEGCGAYSFFVESVEEVELDGSVRYSLADGSFVLSLEGVLDPLRLVLPIGSPGLTAEVTGDLTLNFDNSLLPTP